MSPTGRLTSSSATSRMPWPTKALAPALDRLASWLPGVAEKAAGPNVDREQLALAVLPDLVREEVWPGLTPEHDLP
ncbi:hypothetical protein ACWEQJ_19445 [Streptomyces cyaneofuscatus]